VYKLSVGVGVNQNPSEDPAEIATPKIGPPPPIHLTHQKHRKDTLLSALSYPQTPQVIKMVIESPKRDKNYSTSGFPHGLPLQY
jgi:hypothetical protein